MIRTWSSPNFWSMDSMSLISCGMFDNIATEILATLAQMLFDHAENAASRDAGRKTPRLPAWREYRVCRG
jgi:hypothetical protein